VFTLHPPSSGVVQGIDWLTCRPGRAPLDQVVPGFDTFPLTHIPTLGWCYHRAWAGISGPQSRRAHPVYRCWLADTKVMRQIAILPSLHRESSPSRVLCSSCPRVRESASARHHDVTGRYEVLLSPSWAPTASPPASRGVCNQFTQKPVLTVLSQRVRKLKSELKSSETLHLTPALKRRCFD